MNRITAAWACFWRRHVASDVDKVVGANNLEIVGVTAQENIPRLGTWWAFQDSLVRQDDGRTCHEVFRLGSNDLQSCGA